MRPNRTMTCARCGTSFSTRNHRQRYCSRDCIKRPVTPRPCTNCGIIFHPQYDRTHHCSIACGHATQRSKISTPTEIRFWSYVNKTESCWLWTGNTNDKGYGTLRVSAENVNRYAHRYSWELIHGPIPAGMVACHRCDTPRCVNPDHLFLGTKADNSRDMVDKGRSNRGSKNPRAILTEQDVHTIRALAPHDPATYREICARYGVCRDTIANIIHRRSWKHIP